MTCYKSHFRKSKSQIDCFLFIFKDDSKSKNSKLKRNYQKFPQNEISILQKNPIKQDHILIDLNVKFNYLSFLVLLAKHRTTKHIDRIYYTKICHLDPLFFIKLNFKIQTLFYLNFTKI